MVVKGKYIQYNCVNTFLPIKGIVLTATYYSGSAIQDCSSGYDLYILESVARRMLLNAQWVTLGGRRHMTCSFPSVPVAKWWKQQFDAGVRDIIKEKGCLQLLHLTGNCQLTLTKKGISALATAFKGSVIRWHYKYRIVHGGGGGYIRQLNLTILLFMCVHLYGFI